jgi:hypothetical protein
MSRAGYKGKHGNFTVPDDDIIDMHGMYMQATVGDNVEGLLFVCYLLFVIYLLYPVEPLDTSSVEHNKWTAWAKRKGGGVRIN